MPSRIQRKRTRGWRMPPGAIYVGRPTKWGNPFSIDPARADGAAWAVLQFGFWIDGLEAFPDKPSPPSHDEIRSALRGKDLCCWCPIVTGGRYVSCHADVLLEIANA